MDSLDEASLTRIGLEASRLCAATLIGLVTLGLTGCASDVEGVDWGPHAERYEELRHLVTSEFEREVLADGTITRGEYEEAVDRYVTCMGDAGFDVTTVDQGGYFVYEMASAPGLDEADERCKVGRTLVIANLYIEQLTNPENVDYDVLTVDCFLRAGLVDETYTAEQFDADARAGSLPVDEDDPAFHRCMANPSHDLAVP